MAKFCESEKIIIDKISDDRLRSSLGKIREAMEDIWSTEAPRIVKDYTDHGEKHCERLINILNNILKGNCGKALSSKEYYLLLASIYLHDIGMQCDVVKFPEVKIISESLGASFETKFEHNVSNEFSLEEQQMIRNNHQYLSASWIKHAFSSASFSALNIAVKTIPRNMLQDLMDICMFHSKLNIEDCERYMIIEASERKQLLAALLRFADELDVDSKRVDINTVKNFSLDSKNSVHWWIHNSIHINTEEPSNIVMTLSLNPSESTQCQESIKNVFFSNFKAKNKILMSVLRRENILVSLNETLQIVLNEFSDIIPQDIKLQLFAMDKKKNDPLLKFSEDIKKWLEAIQYNVSELVLDDSRTSSMIATIEQGTIKQKVLIKCIGGEITESDVDNIDNKLDRKLPQGWLISDRRISAAARIKAQQCDSIKVFNFAEFLEKMIWKNYIETINREIEDSNINELYVDPNCFSKESSDDSKVKVIKYIDEWLYERGKMHISILGDFGSGKTWFCKYYTHIQLKKYLSNPTSERLPLLITLRDFTKASTARQLINDAFTEQYRLPFIGSSYNVFQELNKDGKILLILDGFDEMARQVDYQTVVDNFWELAKIVEDNSKVILTCRKEYFHWAEESDKILSGKEYGRKTIVLSPPNFQVIYLQKFNDTQIKDIIIKRLGENKGVNVANQILTNTNLREMARKPVLIELLLATLDEVETNLIKNIANVYLYATNKLLLRNITAQKTFTSTKDKLFFLCELAWEMIKSKELKIHFSLIPEKIKVYFGHKIKDNHELDMWDYDLRSQTLLHNNQSGYYEFAHKSIAEYFVAYKLASELGCLSEKFVNTYCELDDSKCALPYEEKPIDEIVQIFGNEIFDFKWEIVIKMFCDMVDDRAESKLWKVVEYTKNKSLDEVKYIGTNAAILLKSLGAKFTESELACTVLTNMDFSDTDLTNTKLSGANLTNANFSGSYIDNVFFTEANLSNANFDNCIVFNSKLEKSILNGTTFRGTFISSSSLKNARLSNNKIERPMANSVFWSEDGAKLLINRNNCCIETYDTKSWDLIKFQFTKRGIIYPAIWKNGILISRKHFATPYIHVLSTDHNEEQSFFSIEDEEMINELDISKSNSYMSTSHGQSGQIIIWDFNSGKQLAHFLVHPYWSNVAAFLDDEEHIVTTGAKGYITTWNWRKQKVVSNYQVKESRNNMSFQFNQNKDVMAFISRIKNRQTDSDTCAILKVLSYPDNRTIFEFPCLITSRVRVSPDGDKVALMQLNKDDHKAKINLIIISENLNIELLSIYVCNNISSNAMRYMSFSPDNNSLAIGGTKIRIYDININSCNFGKCITVLDSDNNYVNLNIEGTHGLKQEIIHRDDMDTVECTLEQYLYNKSV